MTMLPADEAMKKAGEIFNGYSGRRPDDPMGAEVVGKIIRALDAAGYRVVGPINTHEVARAFWRHWSENGETHKHGHYESTWGAINAALAAAPKLVEVKR